MTTIKVIYTIVCNMVLVKPTQVCISFAKDRMLLMLTTLPLRKTEVDAIAMHMNYTHHVTLVGIAEHHTGSAACPVSAPNKCDSAAVTVCNSHIC